MQSTAGSRGGCSPKHRGPGSVPTLHAGARVSADHTGSAARHGSYDHHLMGRNPLLAVGLGVVLLVISFVVPGGTRDLILRIAGGVAIVAGGGTWLARR